MERQKKNIQINRHDILLGTQQNTTNHFHILWEEVKKNLEDYVTKHEPVWYHRAMQPRYLKPTEKDIENKKHQQTGTRRECTETNNTGLTR